ncbi:MAG: HAD hydrolase-like protein [Candidatus Levyibacteriota bacterium]
MTRAPTLLFDLDGTLTDNYAGISASIGHALSRLGAAPPDEQTLRACVGPPLRESFARLLETTDAARVELAVAHYRERYASIGWRENVVYDGIERMLETLAARSTRMFVCTAKPLTFARRIVAHFGLDPHFEGVYGPGLDGRHDDKSLLLAHLLAQEGIAPQDAVMIGDRAGDVTAARANGVAAIGVLWGYGSPGELAAADRIVGSPGELVAELDRLAEAGRGVDAQSSA